MVNVLRKTKRAYGWPTRRVERLHGRFSDQKDANITFDTQGRVDVTIIPDERVMVHVVALRAPDCVQKSVVTVA